MQNTGINLIFEGQNLARILQGLLITARVAFISIFISLILGFIFGLIYSSKNKIIRFFCRLYLELFRIIPILVWLFIFYFGFPELLDINIDGEVVALIVFIMWGIAETGDIARGALESLPKHQRESGMAIGLNKIQLYRYILLPQAFRRILPGTINLATRMIKTTSLIVMVGVMDVVKIGQQIIESNVLKVPDASFWIYGLIFFLYFIICYPLSKYAKTLENKWNK
jgi:amine acid ABC transporter, permease protein, 3-TM region, His/Glu/Gln/Arg/opine family